MFRLGIDIGCRFRARSRSARRLLSQSPAGRPQAVFTGASSISALLVLFLAGCTTSMREGTNRMADWDNADKAAIVTAPPVPPVAVAPAVPAPPAAQPATTATAIQPAQTWVQFARWCKANGLPAPYSLPPAPAPGYSLTTTNGLFVLRAGSQLAHWDGLEVRLAFTPQLLDGQPCIHVLDLNKTLQPLIFGAPMGFLRTNPIVVIDPGHGGTDSGTRSVLGYHSEKDFTLDWAQRLGSLLASNGWRVFLTRTTDKELSVSNRIAFAEAHKAGVFVSLHFNSSAPNEQQTGLETYCLTPAGMPSTVTRGYGDDLGLAFPNNAFDPQNLQLALRVHRALLQVNGRHDRGVRRARFLGVLRGQHCPAVLVEGGYLSNPQEARRIADPAYRQKLAEAVAQALVEKPELAVQAQSATSQRAEVRTAGSQALPTSLLRP